VNALVRDTWTWNQGILCPGVWSIMKNNPVGRKAADLVRFSPGTPVNAAKQVQWGDRDRVRALHR
jgi:hypothetical protein